ncbi:hypothetical protein LY11_01419 [Pedobacter cryoconitis]|uniref:Uncharacterized protein n=1 Tax=Pedobacter cryoconitis TaxID=188932 RepID=A0A327SWH4_9SPHI|nr:hypothetical protein LY11_01419 [Pedobacter cryoconitis]
MQQRKIISKQIEFKAYKIAKIRQFEGWYGTMFCGVGRAELTESGLLCCTGHKKAGQL